MSRPKNYGLCQQFSEPPWRGVGNWCRHSTCRGRDPGLRAICDACDSKVCTSPACSTVISYDERKRVRCCMDCATSIRYPSRAPIDKGVQLPRGYPSE